MNPLTYPIAMFQGIRTRARAEDLAPAAGPTSGLIGPPGATPLRLGVLGESTAAGCGADVHDNGFTGALARALREATGRPIAWEVVGLSGATTQVIRTELLPALTGPLDIAVLLCGVNDVLERRPVRRWVEDLSAIVDGLGERAQRVVVSGLPPFEAFLSLPTTLRGYLAGRSRVLTAAGRAVCARSGVDWLDLADLLPFAPDFFARDGFHPSPAGYRHWALGVAPVCHD